MIAIPLFADQLFNAAILKDRGVAEYLDVTKLDDGVDLIAEALDKVLRQPIYRNSAELLKRKLLRTPFEPVEKLVKWIEFAAEFGNGNLNELNLPSDDELGFFVYYSIDVILAALILLSVIIYIFITLLKFFFQSCFKKIISFNHKKNKNE